MTFRIRFGNHDAIDPLRFPPVSAFYAHARLRREIEADIERRIDFLDTIDGDPDAEDDGNAEPALGWSLTMATGTADDREEDFAPADPS